MSLKWMARLLLILGLIAVSGCSVIKSWFPDKGRDYQFTSEIPELVIPNDLKPGSKTSPQLASRSAGPQVNSSVAEEEKPTKSSSARTRSKAAEPESQPAESSADASAESAPIAPATSASSLQIDQSRTQAARIVAKALSRQKLEIVERNVDKGYFYVKFDPDAVQASDKEWTDELDFFFGEDPSHEQEYRINLQQIAAQMTEVTVENSAGKTLSTPAANTLLRLITEAIKQEPTDDGEQVKDTKSNKEDAKDVQEKSASEAAERK